MSSILFVLSFIVFFLGMNYHVVEGSNAATTTATTTTKVLLPDFTFDMMINNTVLINDDDAKVFKSHLVKVTEKHLIQYLQLKNNDLFIKIKTLKYSNVMFRHSNNNNIESSSKTNNNNNEKNYDVVELTKAIFTEGYVVFILEEKQKEELQEEQVIANEVYNALTLSEQYWELLHEFCQDNVLSSSIQSLDISFITITKHNNNQRLSSNSKIQSSLMGSVDFYDDNSNYNSRSNTLTMILFVCATILCSTMIALMIFVMHKQYSTTRDNKSSSSSKGWCGNSTDDSSDDDDDDDDSIYEEKQTNNDHSFTENNNLFASSVARCNKKPKKKYQRQRSGSINSLDVITEEVIEEENNDNSIMVTIPLGIEREDDDNMMFPTSLSITEPSSSYDDDLW